MHVCVCVYEKSGGEGAHSRLHPSKLSSSQSGRPCVCLCVCVYAVTTMGRLLAHAHAHVYGLCAHTLCQPELSTVLYPLFVHCFLDLVTKNHPREGTSSRHVTETEREKECMYVCVCVYVCMYVCVYMCMCVFVYVCVCDD
jgi:hypothetical protein